MRSILSLSTDRVQTPETICGESSAPDEPTPDQSPVLLKQGRQRQVHIEHRAVRTPVVTPPHKTRTYPRAHPVHPAGRQHDTYQTRHTFPTVVRTTTHAPAGHPRAGGH